MTRRLALTLLLVLALHASAWAAVGFDTVAHDFGSGTPHDVPITIATNSNRVLKLVVEIYDSGTVAVSTVSGAGATWTKDGGGNGNGAMRGEIWSGVAPSTGAQLVTVTLTGGPSHIVGYELFSLFDADQASPSTSTYGSAISGDLNVTLTAGDMALSAHYDANNNRTISGCTTTRDSTGGFSGGDQGYDTAHCTTSPTSTFTWSGFGTDSIAQGVNVKQFVGGAGGGGGARRSLLGVGQ